MKRNVFMFIGGVIAVYIAVFMMLCPRNGMLKNFYKLENESIDVLFLGSSNAYSNINPAIIYKESGLKSYLLCGSGQSLWNSYYFLKEAYKTQSPDVVVLEVFTAASYDYGYDELSNLPADIFSMKNSVNKYEMFKAAVQPKDRVTMISGISVFHNRWVEIFDGKLKPWQFDEKYGAMEMGFCPVYFFEKKECPDFNETIMNDIPQKNEEYLINIINLAQEHNSKVILVKTPYVLGEYYDGIYNSVGELAKKYNVPFINMNQKKDDLNFDYDSDMADTVHLNNNGVEKVSIYLAKYLKQYQYKEKIGDSIWKTYQQKFEHTKFMSPSYSRTIELLSIDNVDMEQIDESFYIWQIPIEVKKNTFYRIDVDTKEKGVCGTIDIMAEGYDNMAQKRRIMLNDNSYTIIQTDSLSPDKCYIRIYGQSKFDISKVIISELEIEE